MTSKGNEMAEFFAAYYFRRRAIKKVKEAGAISEETAKTSKELGIGESTLQYLVSVKDIKKTKDGRYYVPSGDNFPLTILPCET